MDFELGVNAARFVARINRAALPPSFIYHTGFGAPSILTLQVYKDYSLSTPSPCELTIPRCSRCSEPRRLYVVSMPASMYYLSKTSFSRKKVGIR